MAKKENETMVFGICEALLDDMSSEDCFDSDSETNLAALENPDSDSDQEQSDGEISLEEPAIKTIKYTSKDGTTIWYPHPIPAKTPKSTETITPGVKPYARNAKTELECWKLFFTNEILGDILQHTNAEINSKSSDNQTTRSHICKETTMDELLAMFGLMYIAGLNNSTGYNLTDLWRSDGTGVDIFRMTMSMQRFNFLLGCLRFDDASTRAERSAVDNIALVRHLCDKFALNCQKAYNPSQFITLGEKYIPFRGSCPFRQFLPNSPAVYGLRMHVLVDAKVYYTVNLEIFPGNQPAGPYAISYKPADIVDRLVKPISKTNRNVTVVNHYMCVALATQLLYEHGLTSTGALLRHTQEIPPSFASTLGRAVASSRFGFQEDLTLVSYVAKKSKNIILLSSYHHDATIDKSVDKPKPEILTFYDSTRTGVESVNNLCKTYDVRNYCKSWPTLILYNIMNIAAINAFIVYQENNNTKMRRSEFIRQLGLVLLEEHLKMRKNKNNLPRELRKRIFEKTGETLNETSSPEPNSYKRCRECPSARDRKTKYCCIECKKPICLQHVVTMCQDCSSVAID